MDGRNFRVALRAVANDSVVGFPKLLSKDAQIQLSIYTYTLNISNCYLHPATQ